MREVCYNNSTRTTKIERGREVKKMRPENSFRRCPRCKSTYVYYRSLSNEFRCRSCGLLFPCPVSPDEYWEEEFADKREAHRMGMSIKEDDLMV